MQLWKGQLHEWREGIADEITATRRKCLLKILGKNQVENPFSFECFDISVSLNVASTSHFFANTTSFGFIKLSWMLVRFVRLLNSFRSRDEIFSGIWESKCIKWDENLHRFISMIMALYKHHDLLCHHPFFWSALIFYIFVFVSLSLYCICIIASRRD